MITPRIWKTFLGSVQEIENPSEVFPHAFQFFEEHAEADLGVPGPLVHFWNDSTRSSLKNSVHRLRESPQHTPSGC